MLETAGRVGSPEEAGRAGRQLAERLAADFSALIGALPERSGGPTAVARALGVNRVPVSRLLSAIRRDPGSEMLAMLPGPETLRSIAQAAADRDAVDNRLVSSALEAVDQFEALIRSFGTRAAFDATMSVCEPEALERFEQAGRYQAFRGMSQVLGVEAELWLSTMILTPTRDDPVALDVTAVHGALGMRRLRPDVTVSFTYGAPHGAVGNAGGMDLDLDFSPYYTLGPAPLRRRDHAGNVVHEFCPDNLGKDAAYDMLAGVHAPGHSKRYRDERRTNRGVVVIPDVPVNTLVVDLFVGEGVFEGIEPRLYFYNTTARGPADLEDPARFHDRLTPPVRLSPIAGGGGGVTLERLPRYGDMIADVCARVGYDHRRLRGWRLRVAYPLHGFQWTIAFEAPPAP